MRFPLLRKPDFGKSARFFDGKIPIFPPPDGNCDLKNPSGGAILFVLTGVHAAFYEKRCVDEVQKRSSKQEEN